MNVLLRSVAALGVAFVAAQAAAEELRIGTGAEPTSIDPHYWSGIPNVQLGRHVFDHLVHMDRGKLMPGLAVSWKALDDLTWEFKLREGVKWHDGSPFTADDVVFNFERVPNAGLKQFAGFIQGKKAIKIDDLTVQIKTDKPTPLVPNDLAPWAIVSKKHATGATTEDFNKGKAAVGTGPYRFVEWVSGDRLVLEANPNYWGGKPEFDRVVLKPIVAGPSRVAALLNGDVDLIDYVPTADVPGLRKNAKITVNQAPSSRVLFLAVDVGRDESPYVTLNDGSRHPNPLRDWKVRKAISKSIDRKAIVERVMDGLAVAAPQVLGQEFHGFNPAIPVEAYDPQGARKLLAEAGYPDGFKLTLHGTNDRYDNDAQFMEAITQMLNQVGIKAALELVPKATYFTRASKYEFSLALMANSSSTGDASWPLRSYYHTYSPGQGLGLTGLARYSNSRLDPLIEEALATIDLEKRGKLYQQAMEIGTRDLAYIPIHYQVNTWASKKGIAYEARSDEQTLAHFVRKGG